jgi:hypothetical protein
MHVHRMKRTEGTAQNRAEAGSNFSRDLVFMQMRRTLELPLVKSPTSGKFGRSGAPAVVNLEHLKSERYLPTADQFVSGTACPPFTTVGYTLSNPL